MENVVYLLGAGFSAPLGLPVMSNFLIKAKDMYFQDKELFKEFDEVFTMLKEIVGCKHYFETDLFNIEEILSILEMRESLRKDSQRTTFTKFICEVIRFYTPALPKPSKFADLDALHRELFPRPWDSYSNFIAALLHLQLKGYLHVTEHPIQAAKHAPANYTIITLNYDLVVEMIFRRICVFAPQDELDLLTGINQSLASRSLGLLKLHGSAASNDIIAPTWNKGLTPSLQPVWDTAHKALEEANHIRILGYSLPTSDAYIKYLLRSAVASAPNLKTIDVVCLDHDGQTKRRYDEFINFNFYRFLNGNVSNYLQQFAPADQTSNSFRVFRNAEEAHSKAMSAV